MNKRIFKKISIVSILIVVLLGSFVYVINTPRFILKRKFDFSLPKNSQIVNFYKNKDDLDDSVLYEIKFTDSGLKEFIVDMETRYKKGYEYEAFVFNDYVDWWEFSDNKTFEKTYYINSIEKIDGFPVLHTINIYIEENTAFIAI